MEKQILVNSLRILFLNVMSLILKVEPDIVSLLSIIFIKLISALEPF